jgi:hypothetical protein
MTSQQPYDPAKFREGSRVRIANRNSLESFLNTWKLHNKLQPEQLAYADRLARVEKTYMYHGGYPLYQLEKVPGIWHEQCLLAA